MNRKGWLAALVILSAVLVLYGVRSSPERALDQPRMTEPFPTVGGSGSSPEPTSAEVLDGLAVRETGQLAPSLVSGQVRAADGSPIAGARVSWIALQKEDLESNPAWPGEDWGLLPRARCDARTDEDGWFLFEKWPAGGAPFGSLVVAEHETHYPSGVQLGVDEQGWPPTIELVLEAAKPIQVRVVRADDLPAPGSSVFHVASQRDAPADRPLFERLLAHQMQVDSSGEVHLPPFRGNQALWAESGALRSVPWEGPHPTRTVILSVGPTFTVGGTVSYPDREEWKPDYEGERRILVSCARGGLWRPLLRLRDVQQGSWGPVTVPLSGAARFRVRLEGVPITPVEEEFPPPDAGTHRHVDFRAEKNAELYLFVEDETGRPITTARAVARWGPTESDAGGHVEGASRPDGYLYLGTFPSGEVFAEVTAPGFGRGLVQETVPIAEALAVTLPRARSVRGRCTHEGQPVTDFAVIYWRDGVVRDHLHESFFGREDGSFELNTLTPGDWSLQAVGEEHPAGPVVTTRVAGDEGAQVELELLMPLRGHGRVVDAESGQPIQGAFVQAYSVSGLMRSLPWGGPVLVSPDGTFDLASFAPGLNHLVVEAEGYGRRESKATSMSDGVVEWGEIRLHRPQTLRIRLVGWEGQDPRSLTASSSGEGALPKKRFASDGTVQYEAVPPGELRLVVEHQDRSFERIQVRLEPGEDWTFEVALGGPRRLDVIVLDLEGRPVSTVAAILAAYQEERAFCFRSQIPDVSGHASFAGIRAERIGLMVGDVRDQIIARREVLLESVGTTEVEIRVGERPTRIRVIDAKGVPISGAWVRVRSLDGVAVHGGDDTDATGLAELPGIPKGRVLVDVSHGVAGRRMGVPIDASPDEIEIVLEAEGGLELRVRDADLPLAGVSVRMETAGGTTLSEVLQTNSEGVCRFEGMGGGTVRLACHRSDCWPAVVEHGVGGVGVEVVDVQMRRLGDVELTLRSQEGLAVPGQALRLRSLEFDQDVSRWLEEGRIRSLPGLATNGLGQVRIEGLPRGLFTCSLEGAESPLGAFEVRPGVTNAVTLILPD